MQRAGRTLQAHVHITCSVGIDVDLETVVTRPEILQVGRRLVGAEESRTIHIPDVTAGDADA